MATQGNHPLTETMKHNPHVQHLVQECSEIEEQIRQERAHAWVREDVIHGLQVKKLHKWDEISRQG
jgi:hypothetical protein